MVETGQDSLPLRICRICHDGENSKLISPCNCRGSTKWIHRECLDEWRSTSDQHFSKCEICQFNFVIEEQEYSYRQWRWQYFLFVMYILRDIFYAAIWINIVIVLVADIIYWIDSTKLTIYSTMGINSMVWCYYLVSCMFLAMLFGFVIMIRLLFSLPGTANTIIICDGEQQGACVYMMIFMVAIGLLASIAVALYYIFVVLFHNHRHLLWRGLETKRYQVKDFGEVGVTLA